MRRDPDLIRKLLFHFEEKLGCTAERCPAIEGYSELDIMYHMLLLAQAGFLDHQPEWTKSRDRIIRVLGFGLTWTGHEFLEAVRNDTIWQRAKALMAEKGGGTSFEVMLALLKELAKRQILGDS